jgi:formylglycine-generating enzyme required for sulfatase activity
VVVTTVKKSSWLGLVNKEVEESYTKTVDEWQVRKNSGQASRFIEDLGNGVKLEMVDIPGGEFLMGSPVTEKGSNKSERYQHLVEITSFCMGRHPVTQEQYEALMGINPSEFKGESLPVENVSWNDAQEFCRRLTERSQRKYGLPSEAQWEYACRAGTNTPFYFGEIITTEIANYNGKSKTNSVGIFPANGFGLHDMHGNVLEWCEDKWNENYRGAHADGSAWISGNNNNCRLLRGGSWIINPNDCRSASRHKRSAVSKSSIIGFRLVCRQDL